MKLGYFFLLLKQLIVTHLFEFVKGMLPLRYFTLQNQIVLCLFIFKHFPHLLYLLFTLIVGFLVFFSSTFLSLYFFL